MSAVRAGLVRVDEVRFHPLNTYADMGDLRSLTASILKYGVMQPITVEEGAGGMRLRAGARRLAAAQIAGLTRIPAMIHADALPDREWLEHSIQENFQRRSLEVKDRRRAVLQLRQMGCTWEGIAATFGVSSPTVQKWSRGEETEKVDQADDAGAEPTPIRRPAKPKLPPVGRKQIAELIEVAEDLGYTSGPAGDLLSMLSAMVDGKPWKPERKAS